MSQENFLRSLNSRERLEYLQSNASKIDEGKYNKQLADDEITAAKDVLSENCIKINDLEEELDVIKKQYKEKMKPFRIESSQLMNQIRSRQQTVDGVLYHLANHDSGWMETYNDEGELIGTRKLRPDEKQAGLFPMAKAN